MPRHARHDLRIDQYNTHFTRAEYRMFLALAQWHDQNTHEWLRQTIRREYRQIQRSPNTTRRASVLAWVDDFLDEVDSEAAARRTRAIARPRGESDEGATDKRTSAAAPKRRAPTLPPAESTASATDVDPSFAFISKADKAQQRRAPATQPLAGGHRVTWGGGTDNGTGES